MKAIYKGKVYSAVELVADVIVLDKIGEGDEDDFFEVALADPELIVDPTDGELGF